MEVREQTLNLLSSVGCKLTKDVPTLNPKMYHVRNTEELVQRAISLYIIGTYADNLLQRNCTRNEARKFAQKFIDRYNSESFFSEKEKEFLDNETPNQNEIGFLCWRWESLYMLLWVLGFIGDVGLPTNPCDVFQCNRPFAKNRFTKNLMDASKMRGIDEIIKAKDMVNCCIDSDNKEMFDDGVLCGWNYMLEWILNQNKDWDTITPPPGN